MSRTVRQRRVVTALGTIAALALLDIWKGQRIVTIDRLGDEFLETVQMGDPIAIYEDGTVEVG